MRRTSRDAGIPSENKQSLHLHVCYPNISELTSLIQETQGWEQTAGEADGLGRIIVLDHGAVNHSSLNRHSHSFSSQLSADTVCFFSSITSTHTSACESHKYKTAGSTKCNLHTAPAWRQATFKIHPIHKLHTPRTTITTV